MQQNINCSSCKKCFKNVPKSIADVPDWVDCITEAGHFLAPHVFSYLKTLLYIIAVMIVLLTELQTADVNYIRIYSV